MKNKILTLTALGLLTSTAAFADNHPITKQDVLDAQKAWADGIQ
jgi:hypothetical protein